MTGKQLEGAITKLLALFESVNNFFIRKIARQVLTIGELNQSSINRLTVMAEMNENIGQINQRLAKATGQSLPQLQQLYQQAMNDVYTDPRFARVLKPNDPLSQNARDRLEHYTNAVYNQTAGTLTNLSNTTAVSQNYQQAVDRAVLAVSSGLSDYNSEARRIIRAAGSNGIQVVYASGYKRRLDSAVRQSITDGTKQIYQQGSILMGETLGFDAYEISAHPASAPDHEPVQGRVFLKEEFAKMQAGGDFKDTDGNHYSGFARPIGEWNCRHIISSFDSRNSVRRYSPQQLAEWKRKNAEGCEIRGRKVSLYGATQMMRRIETEVRREKDKGNAARYAGDDIEQQACQIRIDNLVRQYDMIAKASGQPKQLERMRVEGYKLVRIK